MLKLVALFEVFLAIKLLADRTPQASDRLMSGYSFTRTALLGYNMVALFGHKYSG